MDNPEGTITAARRSGLSWVAGWLVEHWPSILIGFGSTAMTWLAAINDVVGPFGAVAWGGVGILSALVLAVVFWLVSFAHRRVVLTRFEVRRSETRGINPLAGYFRKQRITLSDFYHPFFEATKAAKFEECELLGPAVVVLRGGQMIDSGFYECEWVIQKKESSVKGAMAFDNSTFDRCKFFRVTFFLPKELYLETKAHVRNLPPPISDGTAGNL